MSHVHAFLFILSFLSIYSLIYFELFSDFFDCLLSLSPSLYLHSSASMAPKRKSASSRNPLLFGESSFANTTPFSVRFRDEKAKSDFFENFSQRGIHSECQVILLDFSDTDLPTVIYSR